MQRKLKVLDLFSGIGGFALGLDSTGIFETVKFVEKDKYCKKVLQKNFPNIPIEEDIKDVKGKEGDADVIVGGFPCQPMSVAGKRKGTDDDRYLWPEMFRLIREIKPQFVIGENVQGIINIQNGMVLRQVQDQLESEGFEVQCFLIPASGIGAWHQRKRVWIVGNSQHNGSPTTQEQRGNTQTAAGPQKRQNSSFQSERTSRPTDNGDVPNTHDSRDRTSRYGSQREGEKNAKEWQNRSQFESSRYGQNTIWSFYQERKNAPNTQRLGRNEGTSQSEEPQRKKSSDQPHNSTQGQRVKKTRSSMDVGKQKNVSNSQHQRWSDQSGRGHRELGEKSREKEKRGDQSALCSSTRSAERGTDEDVSNSQSKFSYECEYDHIKKNEVQGQIGGKSSTDNVSHTNKQRAQIQTQRQQSVISMSGSSKQKSWWEIESSVCTVPHGVSYELDKDRVNQIKSLGNSIVPQIAYQIFKAIKTAEQEKE